MGQIFLTAANAVLPIVLLILLGYFLKQIGFFNKEFLAVGNKLVFKICLPMTLFMSVYSIDSLRDVRWDVVFYCVALTLLIFGLGIVTAIRTTKVIARRGALELKPNCVINLGIGIPSGVGAVANEEGIAPQTTLSLESGPIGGVPVEGVGFAGSMNAEVINSICDTFDLYDGGYLDMTCLGAAEIDKHGNVNVSKFGPRCPGPGGFINISQNTPKVCFMGGFTAGKSQIEIADGKLNIIQDGPGVKFIDKVQQITFSADYARKTGQTVIYMTERAVFSLVEDGIMLTEIAPGVDLEKDILANMDFVPAVAEDLKLMDPEIFQEKWGGLGKYFEG